MVKVKSKITARKSFTVLEHMKHEIKKRRLAETLGT
jgi:hypothetical protein